MPPKDDDTKDQKKPVNVGVALAGLGLAVLGNIVATVWWAATVSSDVRHLTDGFGVLQAVQYTRGDAERDLRNVTERVGEIQRRVTKLEERPIGRVRGGE